MTSESIRPQTVGRVLRLLVGAAFLGAALALPRWTLPYALRVSGVFVALLAFYLLLGWILSRRAVHLPPWLGGLLSNGVAGAVMLAGTPNGLIFGRGEGFIGAAAYVGLSLLLAAWRADPGCEVMTLPALLLGKHNTLPCLLFTPLDALERNLRRRGEVE